MTTTYQTEINLARLAALMAGSMDSWSNQLEEVKRDVLEPRMDSGDLEVRLAWVQIDHIVCRMRELADNFGSINHAEDAK